MARQLSVTVQPIDYFPMHYPTTYRITAEVEGAVELDNSDLQVAVEHALRRQRLAARVIPAYQPPRCPRPRPEEEE